MTAAILQTPLEVILFFNSLVSHGVKTQSFQTISDALKQDQYIRQSDGFDETRLSPESLQNLYLTLLKDEVRDQQQQQQQQQQKKKSRSASPPGQENGSPASKKRKLSSPPLQSLSDAQQHEHLLPVLVNKLYARYREQAIASVQEEEDNYRKLHSQLVRLNQDGSKARTNGDAGDLTNVVGGTRAFEHEGTGVAGAVMGPVSTASHSGDVQMGGTDDEVQPEASGTPLEPAVSAQLPATSNSVDLQTQATPASSAPALVAAASSTAPQAAAASSSIDQQRSGALRAQSGSPAQAPPTAVHPSRLPQTVPSSSSPAPSLSPKPVAGQSGSIFPPPAVPGPTGSPIPTATPSNQLRQNAAYPAAGQAPPVLPVQYPPQPPRQPFPQRVQPNIQSPGYSAQPSYGQFQLNQPSVPATPASQQSPTSWQQNALAAGHPGAQKQPMVAATPSAQFRVPGQITPAPRSRPNLPPIDTSTSSTKWKVIGRTREKTPERPLVSPLRVELDDSDFEFDDDVLPAKASPGYDSARATPTDKEDTPSRVVVSGRGRGRGGRPRGSGRRNMTRAGSVSASTRTRSQSITSQNDEADARKKPGRKVKQEPGTPAEDRPPSAPSSNAGTPLPAGFRRGRGNTLRANETPPQVRPGHKRKRTEIDIGSPSSTGPGTPRLPIAPTKPGHVLAVRNLPRIAATILNDVTTHKLASMFQRPISEREAPGYRDLVYQPQDLKTIRSMLSAGVKAIAAADSAAQESGTPLQNGPAAGTIWIERTANVLPPRAIVNSGQLETEICRIFANAVMFNPDLKRGIGPTFRARTRRADAERRDKLAQKTESGGEESEDDDMADEGGSLVNDAREMFHDVEKQLAGWRAAERTSAGDGQIGELAKEESMAEESKDEDEAAAAGTEGEEGRPTRRRRL